MQIPLVKMHGSKNTFYVLDAMQTPIENEIELTKWLCDPANNGGADGLLIVLPSDVAYAKMRVINADGSEASMCGNGLRCVSRYICDRDGIDYAEIETMKAILHIQKEPDMLPTLPTFSVEISPVLFDLSALPMRLKNKTTLLNEAIPSFSNTILYSAVAVPNPHLIGIVDKHYIENISHQALLAKYLNGKNDVTEDGVNVSYVYPMAEDEIFVRTYERGVGFTNACGTAMTASALIAYKFNYVSKPLIRVHNPGGFVQCSVSINDDQIALKLIGNATYVEKNVVEQTSKGYCYTEIVQNEEANIYDDLMKSFKKDKKLVK